MLVNHLRSRWLAAFRPANRPIRRNPLSLERLESRDVPALFFDPLSNYSFPGGKDLFVPLTGLDTDGNAITYSAVSDNTQVTATIVTGGTTIKLNVSGKDGSGVDFTGDLYLRLFDSVAPQAVAQIVSLINSNFYDGRVFHRVIDGFMAQGGSANGVGGGSSGAGTFDDEFTASVAFVSPGLVAMANSGDDTNDSQFFIVDTGLPLASLPQHLNYNHTIFGLLVGGFDVFGKLMSTDVEAQSGQNPEQSKPVSPMTINTLEVVTDTQHGVLRISAAPSFSGSAVVSVTANSAGGTVQNTFSATSVPDLVQDRAFLGALNNLTTQAGSPVSFIVPATDLENDTLTYKIGSTANFAALPSNVNVTIDQATGRVTLTPVAGFTGTIEMLVGVRDQTDRVGGLDNVANYDTQRITLTVTNEIDLDTASDSGLFSDDNYTSTVNPAFTITAAAEQTVTLSVNGSGSFATTESSAGVYRVTLPAGTLRLGQNSIGATVSDGVNPPTSLAPLTVTFAPNTQSGSYVVPGSPGTPQDMAFALGSAESAFASEAGFFVVDDAEGRIGALAPGDAGYAAAALARRQIIVTNTQPAGTSSTVALTGGQRLGFYLIQNSSSVNFLASNPTNSLTGGPLAFFSFTAANPDGVTHMIASGDPTTGNMILGWEDLTGGGDRDYNDRILRIHLATTTTFDALVRVPVGAARSATANFQLQNAVKSAFSGGAVRSTAMGEVGYYLVDSPDGRIGTLGPTDSGYAAAALARRHVLFTQGQASGTQQTATLPGDSLLGFYFIPNATASDVLSQNPTNSPLSSVFALFTFAAANPDDAEHFRFFAPEGASRSIPSANEPIRLHASATLFGSSADFDDLVFSVRFTGAGNGGGSGNAPIISMVDISPDDPRTNDTLTVAVLASDPENDPITFNYVWKVNGTTVRNVNLQTFTDTLDLSVTGNGDRGQTVTVEVTPNDGVNIGTTIPDSVVVINTAPTASVTLAPSGDAFNDGVLTANTVFADADGDTVILNYVWKVNGTIVRQSGDTQSTIDTLDLSTVTVAPGDTVTVEVTPTDAIDAGSTASATKVIANRDPVASAIADQDFNGPGDWALDPVPFFTDPDGDTLTFTATLADSSPLPAWLQIANNKLIGNPAAGDAGVISLRLTGTDPSGGFASSTFDLTLSNTPASLNDAPAVATLELTPASPSATQLLTATATVSDGDGDSVTLTYVWKVNGVIEHTTANTSSLTDTFDLALQAGIVAGDVITVEVTPNDGTVDGPMVSRNQTVA